MSSLFSLVSLAKVLSLLLIFSKNQPVVSLIFSVVFLFISTSIYVISSLQLALDLVFSFFKLVSHDVSLGY